jgi:asparagine synthase (glutamine-hydrolysing)
MSVLFGRWNFEGKPLSHETRNKISAILAPYGPDGERRFSNPGIEMQFHAFHTNKESRREVQPYVVPLGHVFMWDGRLDNRTDLIRRMSDHLTVNSTDIEIVAQAYEQWGTECFAQLIGDWALCIWNPRDHSVLLAKDFLGVRSLFYHLEPKQLSWSTILNPLVLFSEKPLKLNEEYIAGWFSFFPDAKLSPYLDIHAVPPGSYVFVRNGHASITRYWKFAPSNKIRYSSDREYEEHFLCVFEEAVRRRLRSDCPVLSELSGGMDSSSIVCIADRLIARGHAETPRLDTLSYFSEAEPNWNERPYFAKVEEKRGRIGCHIDVGAQESMIPEYKVGQFAAKPGSGRRTSKSGSLFAACLRDQGNRVVLSGIGGDEVLGGVPTPVPEFANLLARGHLRTLGRQLIAWALAKRKPVYHLFFDTVRAFLPPSLVGVEKHKRPAFWLNRDFVARNKSALTGYESWIRLFGALPSFQENLSTLEALQRQLACATLPVDPPYEKRYPYLDRDLAEFLYAIPREQLVRPGYRRSLMRRALIGIVPDELLNRKRKAFVARGPMVGIAAEWARLSVMTEEMISDLAGIVDSSSFRQALDEIRQGKEIPIVPIMRTIGIEYWLRALSECNRVEIASLLLHRRTSPRPQPASA